MSVIINDFVIDVQPAGPGQESQPANDNQPSQPAPPMLKPQDIRQILRFQAARLRRLRAH
jgi:hypothetical protein